jgi:hypothetical protein
MSASDDTLLVLTGIGIPDYSARGLSQTLQPINAAAQARRTINGGLVDLSFDQFRKYQSSISCSDQQAPAIDGIMPGAMVTVECVSELCYPTGGTPSRTAVPGSTRVVGAFTFYRPILSMMVMQYNTQTDEYGAVIQWQLDLEEA